MYLKLFCLGSFVTAVLSQAPPPPPPPGGSQGNRYDTLGTPGGGGGTTSSGAQQTTGATTSGGKSGKKGKGGKGKGACFHGQDVVITDRGHMTISELTSNKDAKVLTRGDDGQMEFSSVMYWTHSLPDVKTDYYVYETESGQTMSITGMHLIYQTDCNGQSETIFAKKVEVGKCMFVNNNGRFVESKVVSKRIEEKVGIYAPITTTGSILVNDVLASCFTDMENEQVQKILYAGIFRAQNLLNSLLPNSVFNLFFSSQNEAIVRPPELILSCLELSKAFVK